ncbi:OmpA family protein [Pontibacter sp. H249]|uniref:OmpA family protein n=1 Tax=Pontibacter sp. H249 TaxID=3133420 RepID=UPI0030BD3E24
MKTSTMISLMVAAGVITACNDPKGDVERDSLSDATADTAVMYGDERGEVEADYVEIKDVGEDFWANVNWDAPVVDDPELKGTDVEMRQEKEYNIYTLDDRLLFETDKSQIRPEGEEKLQQVTNELKDLPQNGQIRIFGHADARASNEYNKELSADRANAVKDWLQNKGGIAANRLSIEAMGETAPRATNETARGRQLNRRVAIVAVTRE